MMDFSGSQHQISISHTLQIFFLLSLEASTFPAHFNTSYGTTDEGRHVLLIILNSDIQHSLGIYVSLGLFKFFAKAL